MKFSCQLLVLFALPLASAFGPATPVFLGGNRFTSRSSTSNHQLTMRLSVGDMKRRQKIGALLDNVVVADNPAATKEAIESTVLTPKTKGLLETSNWKVRKAMLRKVRNLASKYDVAVDSSFGTPMPRLEREAIEVKEAAIKREARKVHFDKVKADRDTRVAARRAAEVGTEADMKKQAAMRQTKREEMAAEKEAAQKALEAEEKRKYEASMANADEAEEAEAAAEVADQEKKEEDKKED